jgi:hypothetical protein
VFNEEGFAEGANGLTVTLEWKESGSKVNRGQTAVRMVKKSEIECISPFFFYLAFFYFV